MGRGRDRERGTKYIGTDNTNRGRERGGICESVCMRESYRVHSIDTDDKEGEEIVCVREIERVIEYIA